MKTSSTGLLTEAAEYDIRGWLSLLFWLILGITGSSVKPWTALWRSELLGYCHDLKQLLLRAA
jgi:hypothetical protein